MDYSVQVVKLTLSYISISYKMSGEKTMMASNDKIMELAQISIELHTITGKSIVLLPKEGFLCI